jgi:hypothetical protein
MDMPRLSKSVRRVTVLHKDGNGVVSPVVVFRRDRKKKKQTAYLKPFEQFGRSLVNMSDTTTSDYLRRHKKSNRKHRDGWLRDAPTNIVRANSKGAKKLRVSQFLGM